MPVGPAGSFAVVVYPRFQPSRSEGAAHINIEAGFEFKGSELADFSLAFSTG